MRGLWCATILAIAVAQGQEREPGKSINFYSKDKEAALGRQLALEFRQKTTPLNNPAATDYLNRVGAKLAAQFPGGWTYQFEIVREYDGGTTHEPAAIPGGAVFVPVDLIQAANSEAEFAGMLAHAMAHVVARHYTRSATRGELAQIARVNLPANMPDNTPDNPAGAQQAIRMLSFQRSYEREADHLAVKAMAAAGYDPAGLASYLQRVQPPAGAHRDMFDTLPDRDQRVALIQAAIRQLPSVTYQSGDEFTQMRAQLPVAPAPSLITPPSLIKK